MRIERHVREHDRLSEDLRVIERELAHDALGDARCEAADDDPRSGKDACRRRRLAP